MAFLGDLVCLKFEPPRMYVNVYNVYYIYIITYKITAYTYIIYIHNYIYIYMITYVFITVYIYIHFTYFGVPSL